MSSVAETISRYKADQAAKKRNGDPNAVEHGSIAVTGLDGKPTGGFVNVDANRAAATRVIPENDANSLLVKSGAPDTASMETQRLRNNPLSMGQVDVPTANTQTMETQRILNQPTATGQAEIAPPTTAPDPNDLTGLIGDKYADLLKGNNPALAQGRRTALNGIGSFQANARSMAAERAAASGFAPGSPEFQKILQGAEDNVVSQGSSLLGQVNQAGLDANNVALTGASNFNLGQENFGLNKLANSQNQGYRYDVLGETKNQNAANNTLARDTLNANINQSDKRLGLDTLVANSDIGYKGKVLTDAERESEISGYDNIISHPELYSTAQVTQAKNAKAALMGGVGTGGAPDPNQAQQALSGILDMVKVRYPEMTPAQQEAKARELYGTIDDAQWKSIREAGSDPKKSDNSWGGLAKKWFGDNTGLNGMFKNPIESLRGIFDKIF